MNFSSVWLRSFRVLLFPFSMVYGLIIKVRNYLYDNEIIQSIEFNFPVICIGNISVGGTGKSPMVEYLLRLLVHRYKTATLSRGYKRKTRGYVLADDKTTALDIGDEPMQFHLKYPEVTVAVGEERAIAIPQLLFDRPETDVIILDDALQHRSVKAGLNVLLTDYNNLFTRDFFYRPGIYAIAGTAIKEQILLWLPNAAMIFPLLRKKRLLKKLAPHPGSMFFLAVSVTEHPTTLFQGALNACLKKQNYCWFAG